MNFEIIVVVMGSCQKIRLIFQKIPKIFFLTSLIFHISSLAFLPENRTIKVSLKNGVSKNVRVGNMDATLVLRCLSEPESKADLRSVKISELAQKLTEIATFFFSRKEEKKQKKFSGFLISVPYRSNTGKEEMKI